MIYVLEISRTEAPFAWGRDSTTAVIAEMLRLATGRRVPTYRFDLPPVGSNDEAKLTWCLDKIRNNLACLFIFNDKEAMHLTQNGKGQTINLGDEARQALLRAINHQKERASGYAPIPETIEP